MLASLALVGLLSCALIVGAMVMRLDRDSIDHESRTASGALSSGVETQAKSAFTSGRWDDAVRHLYGDLDRKWAQATISGEYIAYVIDAQGRTLFSRRSDGTVDPPLHQVAPEATRAILKHLPADLAAAKRLKQGYGAVAMYRGRPSLIGAMPIIPLEGRVQPPAGPLRYLVYVDTIDQSWLDRLSKSFGLAGLKLGEISSEDGVSLPVEDGPGRVIAYLIWQPHTPGMAALRAVTPILIGALGSLVVLTLALIRLFGRQARSLAEKSDTQQRLSEQAELARQRAETSRLEAVALREVAEDAARRETRERERSAAAIRAATRQIGEDLRTQLSAIVGEIVASANTLDDSADATGTAMRIQEEHANRVGARSRDAAQSLDIIARNSENLSGAIALIRQEVANTREAIAAAASHSSAAAEENSELMGHVAGIGEASTVIAKVARETNLLALNTAIEAGRDLSTFAGFRVIAGEIKSLSEDTRRSTGLISERLTEVTRAVLGSVRASDQIDEKLQHIHGSIGKASEAVAAQEHASQDIRHSVAAAHREAHAVGELIHDMAASIAQVRRSAETTRQVSAHVRGRIDALETALNRAVSDLLSA